MEAGGGDMSFALYAVAAILFAILFIPG